MTRKITAAIFFAASLGSCSYSYDLTVAARNGQIMIDVDPSSPQQPTCLRRIEVSAADEEQPAWRESVGYAESCANKFPIAYGGPLRGKHQLESGEVAAMPLRRGAIYDVTATTGATGYGGGRFIIRADGRVENL